MKRILIQIATMFAGVAISCADSAVITVSAVTSNATKAVTNTVPMTGYIEFIKVACDAALTGTVTVAGRDETVLIVGTPAAGGSATYRPLVASCWTNGTAFSSVALTNAVRVYLSDERPVITVKGGTIKPTASGDATVTIKVSPR